MKRSRNVLKGYFESGDKPTQAQFVDLIDSFFHEEDGNLIQSTDQSGGATVLNFSDGSMLTVTGGSGGGAQNNVTDYRSQFDAGYIYAGYLLNAQAVITRYNDITIETAQNVSDLETDWAQRLTLNYA